MIILLFPDNCGSTSPISQRLLHTTTFFSIYLLLLSIGRRCTNSPSRKFHSFGRFLQTQPLNEPLTWEAIEALLPPLGPTHRNDPKLIRACLLELGHPPSGQRGTGNQGNLYRQALRTRSHRASTLAGTSTHVPLRNLAPGAANEADKRARPHGGARVLLVLERAAQRSPARGSAGIVRQRLFAAPLTSSGSAQPARARWRSIHVNGTLRGCVVTAEPLVPS